LEDYKKDGTHAKPYYILTIFDELVKKKGKIMNSKY
jgi:hypothetical protein